MATIESTLRTVIVMQDAMSPVINSILNATNMLIEGFADLHGAADNVIRPGTLDGARREIENAGAAWRRLQEQVNRGADARVRVEWGSMPQMPVFQTQGLTRYRQEIEAARVAMANLTSHQDEISRRAQRTQLFSGTAVRDLTSVQNRINALAQNVDRLASRRVGSMGAQQASAQMEALRSRMQQAREHQEALNEAVRRMDVSAANTAYQRLIGTVQNLEREVRDSASGQERFNQRIQQGTDAARGLMNVLHRIVGIYAIMNAAKGFAGMTDQTMTTKARINLMVENPNEANELQDRLFQSSLRTHSSYADTAASVSKLGILAGNAFSNNDEIIAFTELMNKQFAIGGASVQEQSAAMYQLTQAMAAGKLQGDEFRSIMENAPLLAQAIADKMDVPMGKLREMSSQGLITANVIKEALFETADETNERFKSIPLTFAGAWQDMKTIATNTLLPVMERVSEFFNSADGGRLLEGLTMAFAALANVGGMVVNGLVTGAQWVVNNWDLASQALGVLAAAITSILVPAIAKSTLAILKHSAAWITCPATWIILGIIAAVSLLIAIIRECGATTEQIVGTITGVLNVLVTYLYNAIARFHNRLATLAEFFVNMWIDPMYAVDKFFYDMQINALEAIHVVAKGFQDLLNLIPGVQVSFADGINNLLNNVREARDSLTSDKDVIHFARLEQHDYAASFQGGFQFGENLVNSFSGIGNKVLSMMDTQNNLMTGIGSDMSATAANTGATKDSLELGEEEIKYIRILAEREAVNRFTTAEIRVDMGGVTNNVGSNADFDGFFSGMVENVESAMAMAAEGC